MAKGRVSGGTGLNLTAKLNTADAVKEAQKFIKVLNEVKKAAGISTKSVNPGSSFDTKPMSAFQQGVLKLKEELNEKNKVWKDLIITEQRAKAISAEAKAESDILKIAEQELTNALRQGKITRDEYTLSQKRLNDAQKLAASTQREADRQVNQANRLQREQLQLQRQQEAQRERNRRKLQQESSEYYKLNQALNSVRTKSKDLLAEMFKLELQGKKNTDAYRALEARSKSLVSQTQILDRGIKGIDATLGLHQRHVGDYGRALEGLSPRFAMINGQLAAFGTSITALAEEGGMAAFGASVAAVGKNILKFLISPVGLVITAVAALYALFSSNKDTVINFDDKLLNVGKTTNLVGRNLIDLGNEVINLSRKLKTVSSEKLLEYATVAGQLGVKGKDDILAFSEALAKLEIATNINGEQGGAEIARLLTLTDGGVQNVKAFGDEIVNLGNNFAATEKEILTNAESISQNTGLYKVGRQEVLAYAVATKAVGLEAEVVGSSFNRTLATFEKSIRTGKNIEVIAKQTGLSVDQLKAKFKDNASGVFNDFITGLNKVYTSGGSVNEVLENVGIVAVRDQRVIATLASSGYDVLTRSLETVKNASGALNQEFDTASGKLKNQSAKFGIAWDNLVLSVENGQGIIGKSAAAVVGAFTDIVDGLTPSTRSMVMNQEEVAKLTSRYDELKRKGQLLGGEFKLTKDEQEELRKVTAEIGNLLPGVITQFDKYGNALDINRSKIDQMTKAQRELLAVQNKSDIEKEQKHFDSALRQQEAYQKAVVKGSSFFIGEGDVAYFKDKATLMSGEAYKAAKAIRDLGGTLNQSQKDIIDYYESIDKSVIKSGVNPNQPKDEESKPEFDIVALKKEIKDLTAANVKLNGVGDQFQANVKRIRELRKQLKEAGGGVDNTGKQEEHRRETILKSRDEMQKKIDIAAATATFRQLSADDAEVASVRSKYKEMTNEAIKFNDDPKNRKLGVRVDGGKLVKAEKMEVQRVTDKQSNGRLKTQLAEEAKAFEAFEQYKTQYGQKEAEKRFKNQFTSAEAYGKKLEDMQTLLLSEITDPAQATESQKEQLSIVTDAIKENATKRRSIDDATYANAFQAAKTYIQKTQEIENDYQRDKLALGENATVEQLKNLSTQRDARIRSINEENAYAASGYENLMMHYDELTRGQILEKLRIIKEGYLKEYLEGSIINGKLIMLTAEQLAQLTGSIDAQIAKLNGNNVFSKITESIKRYKDALRSLPKDSEGVKRAQKDMYGAIGEGAEAAAVGISGLSDMFGQLGIGGEELGATMNQVAGVISGAGDIAKGIASGDPVAIVTGSIKLLSSAIDLFNFKDKKLARQIKQYQADLDSLGKAYKKLERDVQDSVGNDIYSNQSAEIANLQQQQQKLIAIRDAESQKKKKDQGKINDLNNQIDDIPNKIADINAAISQNLIQGTFRELSTALANALTSGFKAGEDGIASMNKIFDDFVANAIQSGLKLTFLEPAVAQFTKELTEYAKGNGNSVLGFDFEAWKKKLDAAGKNFNEGLEASKDYFKADTSAKDEAALKPNTLTASLNQPTGERLEGLWRGNFDLTKQLVISSQANGMTMGQMYETATANLNVAIKIEANTFRTANNTDSLGEKLDQIITNTKPSKSARD